MASNIHILPRALVEVRAHPHNGSISHQYHMDMIFDRDKFHCKLSESAHLVDPVKKESVYLIFDATNVRAISFNDNDEVPLDAANAFIKQARCTTAADVVSLQFTLAQNVPLTVPLSALQQRSSTSKIMNTMLRLGQCDTFTVYVPSDAINHKRLSELCEALDKGIVRLHERSVKGLYAGAGSKTITCLDDLWTLNRPESPPPYDPSTAPGASNDEPPSRSPFRNTSNSRKREKSRIASPVSRQTPSKRQLLTEKAVPEPWELAFAALNVEFANLREQLKQLQRVPGIDAGTQTDPLIKRAPVSCSVPDLHCSSSSQASTVENTIEDRLLMVEDSIADEHKQLALLAEKVDHKDKQVCMKGYHEFTTTRCCSQPPPTFSLHKISAWRAFLWLSDQRFLSTAVPFLITHCSVAG